MQNLENEMDLFRKAGEHYPLHTGKPNWDDVAAKIYAPNGPETNAGAGYSKRKRNLVALLLIVLFTCISLPTGWMTLLTGTTGTQTTDAAFDGEEKTGRSLQSHKHSIAATLAKTGDTEKYSTGLLQSSQALPAAPAQTNKPLYSPTGIEVNRDALLNIRSIHRQGITMTIDAQKKTSIINEGVENENMLSTGNKTNQFYVGIAAAPEWNKVKSGSFMGGGFSAGFVLGYGISQKLSLETGINWSRKQFNSEGKYFDMQETGSSMPPGMVINCLKSTSNLIEIPVALKFNLSNGKNSFFFAKGGVSAYIITKESNDYNISMNGETKNMKAVYSEQSNALPAVVNLSLGYERCIGDITVSISPFLKLPLKGIGVGKLPVTGTGLQVGFFKSLH